jgi:hypothetical protein
VDPGVPGVDRLVLEDVAEDRREIDRVPVERRVRVADPAQEKEVVDDSGQA